MPILDIQKRARELGRIRMGQTQDTGRTRDDGSKILRPAKLDRFRLTSASKPLLDKVAELYGGQVREWQPQGGGATAWEVITDAQRIPILVPPQPVTQWLEHWTGGGCKRRCDGETEQLSDQPCICKANADAGDSTTDLLCKPTTRLNVILRDVEGIGVWRLETHGWNAATELPDVAAFLAQAGGYVDGFLALEERTSKAEVTRNGETKVETRRFMVPTIEVGVTPAQLLAGGGRVQAPQVEGPIERKAIEAGPSSTDAAVPSHLVPYYRRLVDAKTSGDCMSIYQDAKQAGHLEDQAGMALYHAIGDRGRALTNSDDSSDRDSSPPANEPEPDPAEVWQAILARAGELGMTTQAVHDDFAAQSGGIPASEASGYELAKYLEQLRKRAA